MQAVNKPLGEMLLEIGVISQEQLEDALNEQQKSPNKPLGDILLSLGYIDEKQLMKAMEYRLKTPFWELNDLDIPPEMSQLISHETAKKYTVVAIAKEGSRLTVATADPLNFYAMDDVKIESKMDIRPVLATPTDIKNAIVRVYEKIRTSEAVEDLNKEYTIEDVEILSEEINNNIDNAPVVRLVNLIINLAINTSTSDVHIEPMENTVRIRFRIDGEMYEQLSITKSAHAAVVTRLKIMGNMNIAERRIPQDGRAQTTYNGKPVDLRLSVLPTVNGEKVVIRVLGGQSVALERKELGFTEKNSEMFDEILKNPNGIILVSGPTGSGKSTTLYTILKEINQVNLNIITVEDPVEFKMWGINQVQVNPQAGLTFASGLRSILRQDPDVIMVGEIRDVETAEIAVRASITGHLVLSTIHTNDSASTVSRLLNMGIEPFLVSASLVGVVSQRLVRRICSHCKVRRTPDAAEMKLLGITEQHDIYEGVGCQICNKTGYKGRIAIHEILVINRDIRELINRNASVDELRKASIRSGTTTLQKSCADLVLRGVTTMEELIRVTYTND
ncbi:MAG: GspE/PulE family protein [Oscillospiraceae bacterium]|jgi:type IV pilus assembly protein PilB|nr:GspE/PulE family protein [Oscillospiraceae bacterium]